MDKALLSEIGGPSPEALERLIYVVGSARGGTSITNRVIGMHDDVLALGNPSHFLNHVWRYRKVLHDRLWQQLLWTPGHIRQNAVRESLPEDRKHAFIRLINWAMVEKNLHDLYQLYPIVKALDPDQTRKPDSFQAWLDKGNDFWGVNQLSHAFPDARFVFVVRDPRGAIASLAKRAADRRPDTNFTIEPVDVVKASIYWANIVQKQIIFANQNPGKAIFFCFEDMTVQPVELVQSLFEELELQPIPEGELKRRIANLHYGTSLDSGDKGVGIKAEPNERWRSRLDPGSIGLISAICGPVARRFGYNLPETSMRGRWIGIVSCVPGVKRKAETLAKLLYLYLARWVLITRRSQHALRIVRAI